MSGNPTELSDEELEKRKEMILKYLFGGLEGNPLNEDTRQRAMNQIEVLMAAFPEILAKISVGFYIDMNEDTFELYCRALPEQTLRYIKAFKKTWRGFPPPEAASPGDSE